jgi:hypothetical protein
MRKKPNACNECEDCKDLGDCPCVIVLEDMLGSPRPPLNCPKFTERMIELEKQKRHDRDNV